MVQRLDKATPKYRQIADDLRARVETGEFAVGTLLPTKAELMAEYSAALATVDHALSELRKLGIAESVQGVGTFVREPTPTEADLTEQVRALAERMDAAEREVQGHARLLARMKRRLEEAGISLADTDQRRGERAVLRGEFHHGRGGLPQAAHRHQDWFGREPGGSPPARRNES